MPQLKKGGSGVGALMEPVAKLLKSKENDENWNPALRGILKSAIAGRQYPQARAYAAGWATHNKCLFCLHSLTELGARTGSRTRPTSTETPPTALQVDGDTGVDEVAYATAEDMGMRSPGYDDIEGDM